MTGSAALRQRLMALPTAALSDALDTLSLPGSLHGIGPLRDGVRAVGPAYTVSYEPIGDGRGGTVGDFLDEVTPGSVVVIDNHGRTDCTVWGGIMTQAAASRGISGTVVNGACRDVDTSLTVDYSLWGTARFMRTGKDRVRLASTQTDLVIDDVPIMPGDWVCADSDGVVVIPRAHVDRVVELALAIETTEQSIVEAVRAGSTLADARIRHGYHSLQTPKDPS
jgi:regulator of RNase E activity RraA